MTAPADTAAPDSAPAEVSRILQPIHEMGLAVLDRLPHLLIGLVVFLLFLLAGRLARRFGRWLARRSRIDPALGTLLGGLASALLIVLGLFVAAVIVFPAFKPGDLIAGLGITSIAIGFAFKDILQNWLAGVFLLWRRPFQVGDEIRTKGYEGTVEAIAVRSTILKTYDGERVVVPNSDVYTDTLVVRTANEHRRVRFMVGIGYLDSIEEARETIHRVLRETEGVLDEPGPWVHVTDLAPSSVNFAVYFWVEPRQANLLRVSDRVATGIKLALDRAGIDMPYPHTVVLLHDVTGTRPGDTGPARP
jgi:small conductance mechanosensitive channel